MHPRARHTPRGGEAGERTHPLPAIVFPKRAACVCACVRKCARADQEGGINSLMLLACHVSYKVGSVHTSKPSGNGVTLTAGSQEVSAEEVKELPLWHSGLRT